MKKITKTTLFQLLMEYQETESGLKNEMIEKLDNAYDEFADYLFFFLIRTQN